MPTTDKTPRVLIVDDNRDGADSLGLLVEALGGQAHVTYGGTKALQVATAFHPDLMLIDLVMPDLDGCGLVIRLRQLPTFAQTKIVAMTGYEYEGLKSAAIKAGFDAVISKPIAMTDINAVFASVGLSAKGQQPNRVKVDASRGALRRLPIEEARRIRNERASKSLTQAEVEAAISDGIIRFQADYLGTTSEQIQVHFIKDLLLIRIQEALTLAERQLGTSQSPEKGRDLIKQTRKQLLELARPMLESLVHEVTGVKVLSMHHDISTVTGEEVVTFTMAKAPRFE